MITQKFDFIDVDSMMSLAEQIDDMSNGLTVDKLMEAYTNTENFKGNQAAVGMPRTSKSEISARG